MELNLILGISIIGLLFAIYLIKDVMRRDTGTAAMQEISNAIKAGAEAFLRRQNRTIIYLALALTALIYILYAFRSWLARVRSLLTLQANLQCGLHFHLFLAPLVLLLLVIWECGFHFVQIFVLLLPQQEI